MTLTATALSLLLLATGLAACGWRFLTAFRKDGTEEEKSKIGTLLCAIFFFSAGYNAILGFSSLFLSSSSLALYAVGLLSHAFLTALALISIYTVYYIFMPHDSPRLILVLIGLMGSVGMVLQLASALGPLLSAITFCLLSSSLLATLYLFMQLFFKTTTRSLKALSLTFSILTCISIVYALVRLSASFSNINLSNFSFTEWGLAFMGGAFLISSFARPAIRWITNILAYASSSRFAIHGAMSLFIIFIGWWGISYLVSGGNIQKITTSPWPYLYTLMALWGTGYGFILSMKLGGLKNTLGKGVALLACGLLLQTIGQVSYGFYVNYLAVAIPYPSLADAGFLGSIPFYIYALIQFGKSEHIKYLAKAALGKIWVAAGVFIIVMAGYWYLMNSAGYNFDWHQPIKTILDVGYPLFESLALALGIFIYFSLKKNNGVQILTRARMLPILIGLGFQFIADTNFTYQAGIGSWSDGSIGCLAYLSSYFLMTMGLTRFSRAAEKRSEIRQPVFSPVYTQWGSFAAHGTVITFMILITWWAAGYFISGGEPQKLIASDWGNVYGIIALWGIWFGFKAAQRWGGFKTNFGKAVSFFTIGIFLQVIGQIVFGIYVDILNINLPYPSLADIPYLSSPLLYVIGLIYLGKAFGVAYDLKAARGKVAALITLLLLFSISFLALGPDYSISTKEPLLIVLDIAYPLVEAMGVALVVFIYFSGVPTVLTARKKLLLCGAAVSAQYCADLIFSYQANHGLWANGSFGDLPYLGAYCLMALALISMYRNDIGKSQTVLDIAPILSSEKTNSAFLESLTVFNGLRAAADTKYHVPPPRVANTPVPVLLFKR